ncbi:protein OSB1, mitochondrial isoform X2 [Vigna angularis]|uniref:protein OSB1, mitochondrial isoform X2 n=1 Tax=Phaseolus angularis TaxID=3914 RepID=UPI0022B3120F|nr:protein OSB1, mitochondrial isoform X2 [Vigna angularis]
MEVHGEILRGAKCKSLPTSSATQPKKTQRVRKCVKTVYPTLQKTATQNSPAKFITGGKPGRRNWHASSEPMKPNPFIFTKRYSIPSIFSRYFPFSTHNRHSFDDSVAGCSAVYRHALQFQRPATIRWSPRLENTASFIGSVTREPARINSKTGNFGIHTVLKVRISNQANSSFIRVLLMMWNSVAELALEHLKPNDFIYASGSLGSYTKPDAGGIPRLNYKLYVKEFKFVTQRSGYQGHEKLESANVGMQNNQNRLHLWQVFFSNPNEWWDQRKRKLNSKQPDFKHKDTGEVLWLSPYDPPWVRRQLQLLDSEMAGGRHHSRVSNWVYDD